MYRKLNLRTKFVLVIGSIIAIALSVIFYWMYYNAKSSIISQVDAQASALLHQVEITRKWISDQGGIYIKERPGVSPHPLLSHLDITSTKNEKYLFRNPALVTRELSKMAESKSHYRIHLTSLKLKNPDNAPTPFEIESLLTFERQGYENSVNGLSRIYSENETPYYERTIPLRAEKSCLKCHGTDGYREGDIRGAMTVTIDATAAFEHIQNSRIFLIFSGSLFLLVVLLILYLAVWVIVLKPVQHMYKATQEMDDEVLNYHTSFDLKTGDELEVLSNAFRDMLHRIGETYKGSVKALANAIEARDPSTKGHTERVALYSVAIARQMELNPFQVRNIEMGAILHDIGKIGISDEILRKEGLLTETELEIVRKHPETGANIMDSAELLYRVIPAVLYHHENYDGTGYPQNLTREDIPLVARIISVADAFDAMTTDRPYRNALTIPEAVREIEQCSGTQFDPEVVLAFLQVYQHVYDQIQGGARA